MDLTAITTPYGLLDDATREALKAHGGPYEFWHGSKGFFEAAGTPVWDAVFVYRVKPQPPKPREWWIVLDGVGGFALAWEPNAPQGPVVHVREVTD